MGVEFVGTLPSNLDVFMKHLCTIFIGEEAMRRMNEKKEEERPWEKNLRKGKLETLNEKSNFMMLKKFP